MTRVWIGTAGYSYSDWVGPLYPPGTRSPRMLSIYSRAFPLVELNFTIYRMPTADMLARLAEQTPTGFQFIVKLSRTLSHDQDDSGLESFREAVEELHRRDRLLALLAQFPQSFHETEANRQWVETLARGLAGLSLSVEFRHRSWDRPEMPRWLRSLGADVVSVDVPNLPGLFPRRLIISGSRLYVRFHSRNAGNWYKPENKRYDFRYTEEQLAEWVFDLEKHADRLQEVFFIFNNCYRGQALDNAHQLRGLLRRLEPQLSLVEPFSVREKQQSGSA